MENEIHTNIDDLFARLEAEIAARPRFVRWAYSKGLGPYNLWYWLSHPWKLVTELPVYYANRVRYFFQRGRKGYATSDTWGLHHYILSWLPDALDEIADNASGWPSSDEFPEYEDWVTWLHEMAAELRKYTDDEYLYDEVAHNRFVEEIWPTLGKHFFHLWD